MIDALDSLQKNVHRLRFSYFFLAILLCAALSRAQMAQDDAVEDDFKSAPTPGKRLFSSNCAGCHGLDGHGSDKAPNIAGSARVQHLSDSQISSIISNGVAGTGMPAFRTLKPTQVQSLTRFLRVLQGKTNARALPGNADSGKTLFFGKAECSTCHAISGEGGFIGPDLSSYGASISKDAILKALTATDRLIPNGYKPAAVVSDSGRVEGIIRNEDNFSVQLQSADGAFHSFEKSGSVRVEYLSHSLMPSDYGKRLTAAELNDLVSFLMKSAPPKASRVAP